MESKQILSILCLPVQTCFLFIIEIFLKVIGKCSGGKTITGTIVLIRIVRFLQLRKRITNYHYSYILIVSRNLLKSKLRKNLKFLAEFIRFSAIMTSVKFTTKQENSMKRVMKLSCVIGQIIGERFSNRLRSKT